MVHAPELRLKEISGLGDSAITEIKLCEFSFTSRTDAIYTKTELVVDDQGKPQQMPWEDWRPGEEEHTSGWMRATSPSGDATFVGEVGWSTELGFGLRKAESTQAAADATKEAADKAKAAVGK